MKHVPLFFLLCFLGGSGVSASAESAGSREFGPYRVAFQCVERHAPIFSFRILISSQGRSVTLSTEWRAKDEKEAARSLSRLTGVKEGYLFVPYSCAGGNAWRCELENVLTASPRLRVLGAVGRRVDGKKPGESLREGRFFDGFDGLEINPFTCHAAAPSFEVVLRVRGKGLALDPDATWALNEGLRKDDLSTLQTSKDAPTLASAYLRALALTRACGRGKEGAEFRRWGRQALGANEAARMENYVTLMLPKYKWARRP